MANCNHQIFANESPHKIYNIFVCPYQFIANKFRILFEQGLIKLFDSGELIHRFKNRIELLSFLKAINQDNWRFHFEKPMESALDVIKYIGRYSKRACLSERKIRNIEGEYIEFEYKDYADMGTDKQAKIRTLRLHYRDFCHQEKELLYIIFDKRKPKQRTEKFDMNKHENTIIYLKTVA